MTASWSDFKKAMTPDEQLRFAGRSQQYCEAYMRSVWKRALTGEEALKYRPVSPTTHPHKLDRLWLRLRWWLKRRHTNERPFKVLPWRSLSKLEREYWS